MTLLANAFSVQLFTENVIFHKCYEFKNWAQRIMDYD